MSTKKQPKGAEKRSAGAAKTRTKVTGDNKTKAIEEFETALQEIAKHVGPEAFYEMGIKVGLELEDSLRAKDPENPMLPLIDEWRAKQRRT